MEKFQDEMKFFRFNPLWTIFGGRDKYFRARGNRTLAFRGTICRNISNKGVNYLGELMRKSVRSKSRAFTLTELVVVIFLFAIISSVCVSITLMVKRAESDSQIDASAESELIKLERTFKDHIRQYDSSSYTFSVAGSHIDVVSTGSPFALLNYENNTLTCSDEALSFEEITNISFSRSDNGKLLRLTATIDEEQFAILVSVQAAQTKNQEEENL